MPYRKDILKEMFANKVPSIWREDIDYLLSDGIYAYLLSTGCLLGDLRFFYKDWGVLVMVKIKRSPEGPKIAFYSGKTAAEAIIGCWEDCKGERKKWKEDEWALAQFDKKRQDL